MCHRAPTRPFHTDMSSRHQKKPDARALFKQAKSRKGENGASLGSSSVAPVSGSGASSSSSSLGGKYVGKSKEEVSDKEIAGGIDDNETSEVSVWFNRRFPVVYRQSRLFLFRCLRHNNKQPSPLSSPERTAGCPVRCSFSSQSPASGRGVLSFEMLSFSSKGLCSWCLLLKCCDLTVPSTLFARHRTAAPFACLQLQ